VRRRFAFLVALLVLGSAGPADAYVDPATGSLLLQIVLGGVAGLGIGARLFWRRIRSRLWRRPTAPEPAEPAGPETRRGV
jgi:hypothetical protein